MNFWGQILKTLCSCENHTKTIKIQIKITFLIFNIFYPNFFYKISHNFLLLEITFLNEFGEL